MIINFLNKYNFKYTYQYKVNDRDNNLFFFDFKIDDSTYIEYDGIQHFKPIDYFGGISSYISGKKRDLLKNRYCVDNNVKLIRIPYYDLDILNSLLIYYLG